MGPPLVPEYRLLKRKDGGFGAGCQRWTPRRNFSVFSKNRFGCECHMRVPGGVGGPLARVIYEVSTPRRCRWASVGAHFRGLLSSAVVWSRETWETPRSSTAGNTLVGEPTEFENGSSLSSRWVPASSSAQTCIAVEEGTISRGDSVLRCCLSAEDTGIV